MSAQITLDEAAEFAAFELPANAEVIGIESDAGIDSSVRFAVRMSRAEVDAALAASSFETGLEVDRQPMGGNVVAGVDVNAAIRVRSGQDRAKNGEGRMITRAVSVFDEPAGTAVLHVTAFTM